MENNIEQHKNILDNIHNTYIAKNNDYGNSFSKSFDKYGITCAMVRMEDKWNRLEALTTGKKQMVSDESIKDTLLDLANYAIMTVMELENRETTCETDKNYENYGEMCPPWQVIDKK